MMENDGLCVLLGHLTAIATWAFIGLASVFAVGGFQRLLDFFQPYEESISLLLWLTQVPGLHIATYYMVLTLARERSSRL